MLHPENVLPKRVELIEVGPRDGFQMESKLIPTELKVEIIEQLARSGLAEIEAVSFVHPRVIPQMHDADEVIARLLAARREASEGDPLRSTRLSALVPNLRGAERALAAGVDGVHVVICASESYNQRNVGMSVAESLRQLEEVVDLVGARVPVAATLSVTFGCPFEGQLDDYRLVELSRRVAGAGVGQLGLADTAGLGHPYLVRRLVSAIGAAVTPTPLRVHLHDTRGLGLANALAALEQGVALFDTSLGGLGGCPVMRGASGNVATEDLVNLCREIGVGCGVSLDGVRVASRRIASFLERELPSRVLASGTRAELLALNTT